jgi:MFS family permease
MYNRVVNRAEPLPSPSLLSIPPFKRTQTTWLAYLLLSFYAFMAAMFGPLLPFLRDELGLSYRQGGLHLSALAAGILLAGLLGGRIAGRFGRGFVLRLGGCGAAAGVLLFVFGRQAGWTMAGVLLIGGSGALVQVMVQAILSDTHGNRRSTALTEANIGAGISAMLAPAVVGGFQRLGWGWRPAILLGVGLLLALALSIPRQAIPNAAPLPPGSPAHSRLPRQFWAYWGVVFLAVAVEWCLMVWSADFLEKAAGFARPTAAALMSLFYLAYVLGRVWGTWLTGRQPAGRILLLSFGITLLGFPLFLLPRLPLLVVLGLIVEGFGAANLFPLAMTAAVGAAPDRPDTASARVSLALGSSVLLAPLALGALADGLGIRGAFGIVPPLVILALGGTWLAGRGKGVSRMDK